MILVWIALFLAVFIATMLFLGYAGMYLVNYLFAPSFLLAVFGVTHLTFWRAFWLAFLCGMLFKSFSFKVKQ